MSKRARRNHARPSRRKWLWPRSKARRRWPIWRSNSISIPTRSPNGRRSSSKGRPGYSGLRLVPNPLRQRRFEIPSCQDRRADARERFFGRRAQQGRPAERKAMIDRSHALPMDRQAKALNVSRGSVYYLPRPVSATDLAVMHRMDESHLDFPFAGSRMLRDLQNADGVEIGRLHVATLMKRMGIEAIYRKPNTSKPAPGHKIYPYLLRKSAGRPARSGLGHGYYVHPDGARLRLSRRRGRLVQPPGSQPSGCRSPWKPTSASRLWKKLSPAMADERSSTRIKARSSPARPSRMFFSKPASLSAWTARAHGATMSS